MERFNLILLAVGIIIGTHTALADSYARGTIAGSCTQQVDGGWNPVAKSATNSVLTNAKSEGIWPVISCPEDQGNLAVKCAEGWKLVSTSIVQISCTKDHAIGGACYNYLVNSACAKL